MKKIPALACALYPLTVLIAGVVMDDLLWAFWAAFPVLPLIALVSALYGRARFDVVCVLYGIVMLAEGAGDPMAFLGGVINEMAGLGAVPRATGLAAFALLCALMCSLTALHRWTLSRVVASVGTWGLLGVVTAFHLVVVNAPFQAARSQLDAQAWAQEPCGVGCFRGEEGMNTPRGLSERLSQTMRDIAPLDKVSFCWIESDITLNKPALDICVIKDGDQVEARMKPSLINPFIDSMRQGFALLSLLFMSAWSIGVVYVISRHGPYERRKGRWVKIPD